MERLLYTNFLYNDPVQLRFDPPLVFTGDRPDRTLTYCALYDNGFTDPTTMKRQSTSPLTPWGTSTCATPTTCYAGKVCAAVQRRHRRGAQPSCDSSPGAGDGLCDGCTLTGGVTTEDEMFLLLGSFYRREHRARQATDQHLSRIRRDQRAHRRRQQRAGRLPVGPAAPARTRAGF